MGTTPLSISSRSGDLNQHFARSRSISHLCLQSSTTNFLFIYISVTYGLFLAPFPMMTIIMGVPQTFTESVDINANFVNI